MQAIRSDITAANPDLQFSFRESIEPVYRELVALLLETPDTATKSDSVVIPQPSQENLDRARQIIELLQLAELDNFFRAACVDANPEQIDLVDENASIFYSILLGDRLEVIFAQKDEPLRYQSVEVSQTDLKVALTFIQNYVTRGGQEVRSGGGVALAPRPLPGQDPKTRLERFWINSEQMYDWLVAPFETYLTEDETLVFVLDGILRSIPMSVLYDGEQYLIEKYSVALTPGLQLLDPEPLQRQELSALTGGISEEVRDEMRDFDALPFVENELQRIQDTLQDLEDTSSEKLLNKEFLSTDLQARIQAVPFSVVHLATHGQFSSREEETFLLTWDMSSTSTN
ncbi:MAG: CHAT domain-containing protein [Coleofasciculaceae cyanobacterium SM2_3_26]|nr:CHAT domain-containing protein [Coleofasciculaceae cyanobacterium SM2_3_26]